MTWPGITVGEVCGLLAGADGWTTVAVVDAPGGGVLLGAISRHRLQREVDAVIAAAVAAPPPAGGADGGGYGATGGGGAARGAAAASGGGDDAAAATAAAAAAEAAAVALADGTTAAAVAATPLPLLAGYDPAVGAAAVNPTPFAVTARTPFWKVAHLFTALSVAQMFVTGAGGAYVGVLSKARFIDVFYALSAEGGGGGGGEREAATEGGGGAEEAPPRRPPPPP